MKWIIAAWVVLGLWWFLRSRRRRRVRLPGDVGARYRRELPGWASLDEFGKKKHLELVAGFLKNKNFEGCQGAVVTEAMRVKVAGLACLLWMPFDAPAYPKLSSILIYPGDFKSKRARDLGGGAWLEEDEVRAGESWDRGAVILAGLNQDQGPLIVVHEFAHQLDAHDMDGANGNPPMPNAEILERWRTVWPAEMAALRSAFDSGESAWLDSYALENEAEFFAVAVETFIDDGNRLSHRRPTMYELLAEYFGFRTAD